MRGEIRLIFSLAGVLFLQCVVKVSARASDRTALCSQPCTAILSRAPGPGIASMRQQQSVPCAIRTDKALGSQQILLMGGQWWAGAVARCPHVLSSPKWRAVLVNQQDAYLIARLLGLTVAAQHMGLEHCGQGRGHGQRRKPGSGAASEDPGNWGQPRAGSGINEELVVPSRS